MNNPVSLINKEVDESSPGRQDGSLYVAFAQKLLSDGALENQLLYPAGIFGHLHRDGHHATGLVVYLRARNRRRELREVTERFFHLVILKNKSSAIESCIINYLLAQNS